MVSYSVGRVAQLAGVSVRTLHHYHEIGLLQPGERSLAGYRLYGESDLERLHQILLYRELGFSLEEVAVILDDPQADPVAHLRRQHRLLGDRIERLRRMAAAVSQALEAIQMQIPLNPEERLEAFGDFRSEDYEEEARERWGETDAYKESQRHVASYTKEDWIKLKAEAQEIDRRLVTLMESGEAPDSEKATDAVEQHRQHIARWFYECSSEIHVSLAQMYVNDPRFKAHYDATAPGLAEFIHQAAIANAKR